MFLIIPYQTSLALDETIITASPLENAKLRHEVKGEVEESFYSDLKEKEIVLSPSIGRPGVSIRGSQAADRVYHLYKKAPLHIGDGSGSLSDLFGKNWVESYSILKSPSSNIVGSGSLSGSLQLKSKFLNKNKIEITTNSIDEHSISIQSPLHSENQKWQLGFEQEIHHGSYDHKKGLGYDKGRVRQNSDKSHRVSLQNQFSFEDYKVDSLVLASKAHGEDPPLDSKPKNRFNRESFFYSTSFERPYKSFLQFYYLRSDNQNYQTNFNSSLENERYGLIGDKTFYLNNRLILTPGFSYEKFEADNQYSNEDLKNSKEEIDTYLHLNYPYKGWMIEPQVRYLWEYESPVLSMHFTKATYSETTWLSYAEGFRAPTIYDLYFDSNYSISNPDLQPEESYQIEMGYKNETYLIKTFFIEYQNLFQYEKISGKSRARNLDSAKVLGLELEYTHNIVLHEFKIKTVLQEPEGKSDSSLNLSPKQKLLLYYSYYWGPMKWSLYTKTWRDYYLKGEKADSWTTLNLAAQTNGFKDFFVKLKYENILRRQITFTKGYPEPLDLLSFHFTYTF